MLNKYQLTNAHPINSESKRKFSFVEIFTFLLICGQIGIYIFMWYRLLEDPSLKTMDFISFYAVGRLIRSGEYKQIYNFDSEGIVQRQVVGGDYNDPLIFNHPPYITPLQALIAHNDYTQAYIYWTILRFLLILVCGELVRRFLIRSGWQSLSAILGALGCITFLPLFISLLIGQDTVFTMVGLFVWMFALLKGKEISAGLGLAFATLSPTIAGALALPLLASRRHAGLWFIAGSLGLSLYSLLLVGVQGLKDLLKLLQISSQGQYYGFDWSTMYNILGFLVRAFPDLSIETARSIAWGAAIISILAMCILWWNKRDQLRIEHIGIAITLATLTSPHLNIHALSYLLLPLLGIITKLYSQGHKTAGLVLIPVTSTVLIITLFLIPTWNFTSYYLLMFSILIALITFKTMGTTPSNSSA